MGAQGGDVFGDSRLELRSQHHHRHGGVSFGFASAVLLDKLWRRGSVPGGDGLSRKRPDSVSGWDCTKTIFEPLGSQVCLGHSVVLRLVFDAQKVKRQNLNFPLKQSASNMGTYTVNVTLSALDETFEERSEHARCDL